MTVELDSHSLDQLRRVLRPTTFVRSKALDSLVGTEVLIASETFQHTGSFKFRAAYNAALRAQENLLIAASSGNFGQALAYSCQLLGKSAIIVMPSTSQKVKVEAVRRFGQTVELVDVTKISRAERLAELKREHPEAAVLSPYNHQDVIDGNSTLADELAAVKDQLDCIIAPVGGGGLCAGIVQGLMRNHCVKPLFGAEPLAGNDAARSLEEGKLIANQAEPNTIADGARTVSLGQLNFTILKDTLAAIIEVPDQLIEEAVRVLYHTANLKVEPTGALPIGALLANPNRFAGRRVCCVISGGNVDPQVYCRILAGPNQS